MKVYQKINQYISENGIKQKYISEKCGIAENVLSMILNGKRKLDADEFVEIILVLGVEPNYFINNKETKK